MSRTKNPEQMTLDLATLEPGEQVGGLCLLTQVEPKTTKAGAPMIKGEVRNETGSAGLTVWQEHVPLFAGVPLGAAIELHAEVKGGYQGGPPELSPRHVEVVDLPADHPLWLHMNPICPTPVESLDARYDALVSLLGTSAKTLLDSVIDHVGVAPYRIAPAALVGNHHGYIHGLYEHSIEVAEIALDLCRRPAIRESVDVELVIVGALLHDVGKVYEYLWQQTPIRLSVAGRWLYHTVLGPIATTTAIHEHAARLNEAGVTDTQIEHLMHVQSSHHGRKEYGSPTPPRSAEAVIVHHADDTSAKAAQMRDAIDAIKPDTDGWAQGVTFPYRNQWLWSSAPIGGGQDEERAEEVDVQAPREKAAERDGVAVRLYVGAGPEEG